MTPIRRGVSRTGCAAHPGLGRAGMDEPAPDGRSTGRKAEASRYRGGDGRHPHRGDAPGRPRCRGSRGRRAGRNWRAPGSPGPRYPPCRGPGAARRTREAVRAPTPAPPRRRRRGGCTPLLPGDSAGLVWVRRKSSASGRGTPEPPEAGVHLHVDRGLPARRFRGGRHRAGAGRVVHGWDEVVRGAGPGRLSGNAPPNISSGRSTPASRMAEGVLEAAGREGEGIARRFASVRATAAAPCP